MSGTLAPVRGQIPDVPGGREMRTYFWTKNIRPCAAGGFF
nr:MAG TPA: hypothetical protein [Caudoviricetes sp.]